MQALETTIKGLRAFVPAKDFRLCLDFYQAVGFRITHQTAEMAELYFGQHSFLLQNYFRHEWKDAYMMHLLVDHLGDWWRHIESLRLEARFSVAKPVPPAMRAWGLTVAMFQDPSGVLWHVADAQDCQRLQDLGAEARATFGISIKNR